MTGLFSAQRRMEVLENLAMFFQSDQHIASVVLVGSGAEDTVDMYSGLDLLVLVKNGSVFPSVYQKWKQRLSDLLPVEFAFEIEQNIERGSYAMMLDDYLELNLYFMPLKSIFVDRQPWRILFDQTDMQDVDALLQASYRRERIVGPTRSYKQMMTSIWQPIIKCVAAVNRGEVWRALHMLERVRYQTIELAALNYGVDTRNYAEVDHLPEMLLVKLRHTLPLGTDPVAIRRALLATTDLFFHQAALLEESLNLKLAEEVRQKMMPYIEAYS